MMSVSTHAHLRDAGRVRGLASSSTMPAGTPACILRKAEDPRWALAQSDTPRAAGAGSARPPQRDSFTICCTEGAAAGTEPGTLAIPLECTSPAQAGSRRAILLVEDYPNVLMRLGAVLRGAGHDVISLGGRQERSISGKRGTIRPSPMQVAGRERDGGRRRGTERGRRRKVDHHRLRAAAPARRAQCASTILLKPLRPDRIVNAIEHESWTPRACSRSAIGSAESETKSAGDAPTEKRDWFRIFLLTIGLL